MAVCHNESRNQDIAKRACFADGFWQRAWGLLGRGTLACDEALYIPKCRSIHTWFMRFSIDVAFVDADGSVVKIAHNVRPFRVVFGPWRARGVWEMTAGSMGTTVDLGEKINLV